MQNSSEKKRCLRRLADSNIWIAFRRIGRLDLLLSVPGIAIAKCVVRELRLGTDDLAERIERRLGDDCFSVEIGGDETTDTLADVLKEKDERLPDHVRGKRLSDGDALQVAYAKTNSATTILYMRDGRAERQARGIGAPVKPHGQLVDDMVELGVVTPGEGLKVRAVLDAYFDRRRRRSPS